MKRPDPATERPAVLTSPAEDVRRLRRNAAASAAELREFLAQLRGKSPKEMLGMLAASHLFRDLIKASKWTAIVLLVFTALPFAWKKIFTPNPTPAAAAATQAPVEPKPTPQPQAEPPATVDVPSETKTADKLGIGEEKSAPPNVNPLDASTDDLLKELK